MTTPRQPADYSKLTETFSDSYLPCLEHVADGLDDCLQDNELTAAVARNVINCRKEVDRALSSLIASIAVTKRLEQN